VEDECWRLGLEPDGIPLAWCKPGLVARLGAKAMLSALAGRLREPPEDGRLWSGPKVTAWMARHLKLERVHPQRGWAALKRLGWSVQAPQPRRTATPARRAVFKGGSIPPSPSAAPAATQA
jgi:hypothetical protein